ncbi:MAG: hypothetical protein V3T70_04355, partial [Phycisphaerae bacterium]
MVETVAPSGPVGEALKILTACGLGEPRLWIRRQADLSDGEQFRAALARAVGQALADPRRPPIICDEFTALLHRRLACCVSHNLRKLISRTGLTLVLASAHLDLVEDLQPDTHVSLGGARALVTARQPRDRPPSIRRRVHVEPGQVSDYRRFAPMHYRHRDVLGFVDKVFLLSEGAAREPLGIAVLAHAPIELSLRHQATEGRFVRNGARLNRELRILRRLVMHPDVRGCGLGHWFVRQVLPQSGVRFVECLAAMGAVNPVFEKAGMTRIGRCPPPRGRLKLLQRMQSLELDPFSPDFIERIRRYPRVRRLVESTIKHWHYATRGSPKPNLRRRAPDMLAATFRQLLGDPPVYFLWDRLGEFPRGKPADLVRPNPLPSRDR